MMGDAAMSRPVIELVRWRSASESSHHAAMISKNANPSRAFQWLRTIVRVCREKASGSSTAAPTAVRARHQHGNRHALDGDLDHQIGDAPDDAHREEQDPSTRAHIPTLRNVDKRNSRVAAAVAAAGVEPNIKILDADAKTAVAAADQLGCEVGAIANSLVFDCDGEPLLVMASGAHRVDTELLARVLGATALSKAAPQFVRSATDQVIGGVAPTGHPSDCEQWSTRRLRSIRSSGPRPARRIR